MGVKNKIIYSIGGLFLAVVTYFSLLNIIKKKGVGNFTQSESSMTNFDYVETQQDNLTEQWKKNELAIRVHIAEYNSVRQETDLLIDIENKLVNYGVIAIAGIASVLVINNQTLSGQPTFLLLIASMLLSSLSWALSEAEIKIHDIGTYLRKNLIPRIQALIDKDETEEYLILQWSFSRNRNIFRIFLRGFTGAGKFLITLIPSLILIVAYYYGKSAPIESWDLIDKQIFNISIIMVMVIPISLILNIISNVIQAFRSGGWKKYLC